MNGPVINRGYAVPTEIPAPPTGLTATAIGNGRVRVTWNGGVQSSNEHIGAPYNTIKYVISYKTASSDWWYLNYRATDLPATASSHTLTGLTPGVNYTVGVWVVDNYIKSGTATTYVVATGGATLDAPTELYATPSDEALTVTWDPVSGAASYEFSYDRHGVIDEMTFTNVGGALSRVLTGLSNDIRYAIGVRAVDAGGNKGSIATVFATPGTNTVFAGSAPVGNSGTGAQSAAPVNNAPNAPAPALVEEPEAAPEAGLAQEAPEAVPDEPEPPEPQVYFDSEGNIVEPVYQIGDVQDFLALFSAFGAEAAPAVSPAEGEAEAAAEVAAPPDESNPLSAVDLQAFFAFFAALDADNPGLILAGACPDTAPAGLLTEAIGANCIYRLAAGKPTARPAAFRLLDNYPNPFNPTTTLQYRLAEATSVRLTVHSLAGQRVRTLVAADQPAGFYSLEWDATDDQGRALAAGPYFYRLQAGDEFVATKKMLLLK